MIGQRFVHKFYRMHPGGCFRGRYGCDLAVPEVVSVVGAGLATAWGIFQHVLRGVAPPDIIRQQIFSLFYLCARIDVSLRV